MKEIIEEIHNTFYTEYERILVSAKENVPLTIVDTKLTTTAERLAKLGFTSSKPIQEASKIEEENNRTSIENRKKEDLVEAINYFSFKYPFYRFITENSVEQICKKYGLVYSEVKYYIGSIPNENIEQIENFKIDEEDKCFFVGEHHPSYKSIHDSKYHKSNNNGCFSECPLEICAPLKDFNNSVTKGKNYKLEILDPVVLQPVYFKGMKHYLIVTAWGDEASDEMVVNPLNN